jgi:hypothetical protein
MSPSEALPEITSLTEGDFVDLVFRVQDHKTSADGSQVIRASGLHKGRKVGFDVVLSGSWKKGRPGKDFRIETGLVAYRSIGPESDAFLQILDELYRTNARPKAMAADTLFAAVSLEGNPGDLASGPVKIKLFYGKDDEDRYAELYTNIDLSARKLEVREKDADYRNQVVRAFRSK